MDNSIEFGMMRERIGTVSVGPPSIVLDGTEFEVNITLLYPTKEARCVEMGEYVRSIEKPTGRCVVHVPSGIPQPRIGQGFVDRFLADNEPWILTSVKMNGNNEAHCTLSQAVSDSQ